MTSSGTCCDSRSFDNQLLCFQDVHQSRFRNIMIGKQPHPYRWVAADDYARMVVTAYGKPDARNHIFHVFGPEYHRMHDLLVNYVNTVYPEIKKCRMPLSG